MDEAGVPPAPVDPARSARAATVQRASEAWQRQLVDLSGRNRLLYFRDQQLGTIDLAGGPVPADRAALGQLLAGGEVRLSHLYPRAEAGDGEAAPTVDALTGQARRARAIAGKAAEMFEERGIRTLCLALGMAHWSDSTRAAEPAAPIVLFPLELQARGAAAEDFDLQTAGEPQVSPTLVEKLAADFGLRLDAAELDDVLLAEPAPGVHGWPIANVLARITEEADGKVPGFRVVDRTVIGNFSYHKLPMVKDLEAREEQLVEHDLIAAIAGDEEARAAIAAVDDSVDVDPARPDHEPPDREHLVLDADGTQSHAINTVLAGSNLVVKGPPGTGKSQTIANLIAALAARRQRVLFVAEKRAAIDAVLKRLEAEGLGHLVMDLHHQSRSRRLVAQDLQAALDASSSTPRPDLAAQQSALVARRDRLNRYTESLHRVREPWGESMFSVLRELPGIDPVARVDYRFPEAALLALDRERAPAASQVIRDFVGLGGFPTAGRPWAGAVVNGADDVRAAIDAIAQLRGTLASWQPGLARAAGAAGLPEPADVAAGRRLVGLLGAVNTTLASCDPSLFSTDLGPVVAGYERGWFGRTFSSEGRAARAHVRAAWRDGTPKRAAALGVVQAARDQQRTWAEIGGAGGSPRVVDVVAELAAATEAIADAGDRLSLTLPATQWSTLPFAELATTLDDHAAATDIAIRLPELTRLWDEIGRYGVEDCYRACAVGGVPGPLVEEAFRHCRLTSIYERELVGEPELATLHADFHDEVVEEFRTADRAHVDSGAARVRRAVAEWIVETRDAFGDQSALVAREAGKSRRHVPLRRLFAEAPDVLTALKPCWAMSPLEVSQLLPGDKPYFDVVVFDEASQVTPADAIPSILRGERVVVAGDQQQLPPTSFFLGNDDDTTVDEYAEPEVGADGDPDAAGTIERGTAGFESILDVLGAILPSRTLGWHYRSEDERLIAFSNVYFYDQSLLTFPGVHGGDCLHHLCVPPPAFGLDANESAAGEVMAVVGAILEHAATRPDESLGVIALGSTHADRISELLRRSRPDHPELDAFFAPAGDGGPAEPFFVKNLERVQGDERDAIILSIGYGKRSVRGELTYHFGPLLTEGGQRRLNVAITRARKRLTLASSFGPESMDPARSTSRGVELLRRYVAYVASGGTDLGSGPKEHPKLNPFEIDVRDRLTAAGIPVIAQYGVSGYSIDFVATDRDRPGRLLLAIECDGASYHAQPTARDRDRLRQQQLERLGWRFHRIWSTDWFADPAAQTARVVAAYERALAAPVAAPVVAPPSVVDLRVADPIPAVVAAAAAARARGPRPVVEPGHPIGDYRDDQLVALATWIRSDTLLRTEDELVSELMRELGFKRHGRRIDTRLHAVAARSSSRRQSESG